MLQFSFLFTVFFIAHNADKDIIRNRKISTGWIKWKDTNEVLRLLKTTSGTEQTAKGKQYL